MRSVSRQPWKVRNQMVREPVSLFRPALRSIPRVFRIIVLFVIRTLELLGQFGTFSGNVISASALTIVCYCCRQLSTVRPQGSLSLYVLRTDYRASLLRCSLQQPDVLNSSCTSTSGLTEGCDEVSTSSYESNTQTTLDPRSNGPISPV